MGGTGILSECEGPRGATMSRGARGGFESLLQEPQAGAQGRPTSAPPRASWHQAWPRHWTLACRGGTVSLGLSPRPGPPPSGLCSAQFWGDRGPHTAQTAPWPPQPRAHPHPQNGFFSPQEAPADPQPAGSPPTQTPLGPPGTLCFENPHHFPHPPCTVTPALERDRSLLRRSLRTPGTGIISWNVTGAQ